MIKEHMSWLEQSISHVKTVGKGFRVEGRTICWDGKENDLKLFRNVIIFLLQTAGKNDECFRTSIPRLKEVLLKISLMEMLNDPNIKVSPDQKGNTPFIHTVEVLERSDTTWIIQMAQGLVYSFELLRFLVRIEALLHDLGKIFGAVGSESRFHPFISAVFAKDIIDFSLRMSDETLKNIIFPIAYHHTYQEHASEWSDVNDEKLSKRLAHPLRGLLLHALSRADVQPDRLDILQGNEERFAKVRQGFALMERQSAVY